MSLIESVKRGEEATAILVRGAKIIFDCVTLGEYSYDSVVVNSERYRVIFSMGSEVVLEVPTQVLELGLDVGDPSIFAPLKAQLRKQLEENKRRWRSQV